MKYANVTSTLALVVALSGTSYAAASLATNSVGTPQLKKNSVVSKKVKNGSLRAVDFAPGQLPAGQQGPQGKPGSFAAVTTKHFQASAELANGANQSYSVFCGPGLTAIGGGGRGDDTLSEETILTNTRPAISAANTEPPLAGESYNGWRITIVNPIGGSASGIRPEVWVTCVPTPTP